MRRILRLGHQCGFTLIEIAVVLLILSVILIAAMGVINAQVKKLGYEQTDKHREVVSEYLKMYLRTNRHLPCADNDQDGIENRAGPNPTDACDANAYEGVIPYATLGLDRDLALDGWENFFTYRVTPDWTDTDTFRSGIPGILDNIDTAATEESVIALISHGPNGLGAFNISGQNAAPTDADEDDNRVGTGHDDEYNKRGLTAGSDYDDLVLALESPDLLAGPIADGSIPSPVGQAREDLRRFQQEILANTLATQTNPGCAPSPCTTYNQYTLTGPNPMGNDPWGNAYNYVAGAVGTYTLSSTGVGDAYALTSNGPPGGPAIIQSISVSAMTGALANAGGFVVNN